MWESCGNSADLAECVLCVCVCVRLSELEICACDAFHRCTEARDDKESQRSEFSLI